LREAWWRGGGGPGAGDSRRALRPTEDSDLVGQLSGGGLTAPRAYEPHRDLLAQAKNEVGTGLISQYDYANDSLGRRTSVVNQGDAFGDGMQAWNQYLYDDRSQLTNACRDWGADTGDTSHSVAGQARRYEYDTIGNRACNTGPGGERVTNWGNSLATPEVAHDGERDSAALWTSGVARPCVGSPIRFAKEFSVSFALRAAHSDPGSMHT
jgi:YD repeat-containing protein